MCRAGGTDPPLSLEVAMAGASCLRLFLGDFGQNFTTALILCGLGLGHVV